MAVECSAPVLAGASAGHGWKDSTAGAALRRRDATAVAVAVAVAATGRETGPRILSVQLVYFGGIGCCDEGTIPRARGMRNALKIRTARSWMTPR